MTLDDIIAAAKAFGTGEGGPPVDKWSPERETPLDMVIKRDGSWWHEGGRIMRESLVKLFASILRRDEDGTFYLVTPVEKAAITVEHTPFLAVRLDVSGAGPDQRIFMHTNLGDIFELGPDHPLSVTIDPKTGAPDPRALVRGRLQAALTRPVYMELAQLCERREQGGQTTYGVNAGGEFYPLWHGELEDMHG